MPVSHGRGTAGRSVTLTVSGGNGVSARGTTAAAVDLTGCYDVNP